MPPNAGFTHLTNASQSYHETFSTGLSPFLKREWLLRITLSHWLWVTSYLPSQNPFVSVTE